MLTKIALVMEKVTGWLLGSCAMTVPLGNVVVCIAVIFFGTDVLF